MKHQLRFLPEARAEILEAASWYRERSPRAARDFTRRVEAATRRIARYPFRYPRIRGEVRRLVMARFPYSIIYLVTNDEVVVLSCFHQRRDPAVWIARFEDEEPGDPA